MLAISLALYALFAVSLASFVMVMPGTIEKGNEPDVAEPDDTTANGKLGMTCRDCDVIKVPRSHHCSQCGRCILRMNYHWWGNDSRRILVRELKSDAARLQLAAWNLRWSEKPEVLHAGPLVRVRRIRRQPCHNLHECG